MHRLSPSSINVFCDCPRCFWLQIHKKFKRPRGIFPSLPGGMDSVFKEIADKHRSNDNHLQTVFDQIDGRWSLWGDCDQVKNWRLWQRAPRKKYPEHGVISSGGLDDIAIELDSGEVGPFDWKTSSHEPRDCSKHGAAKDNKLIPEYAARQLDIYASMLQSDGMYLEGRGFIGWIWPKRVWTSPCPQGIANVEFGVAVLEHQVDVKAADDILKRAGKCLAGKMPKPSDECEYCSYVTGYAGAIG